MALLSFGFAHTCPIMIRHLLELTCMDRPFFKHMETYVEGRQFSLIKWSTLLLSAIYVYRHWYWWPVVKSIICIVKTLSEKQFGYYNKPCFQLLISAKVPAAMLVLHLKICHSSSDKAIGEATKQLEPCGHQSE